MSAGTTTSSPHPSDDVGVRVALDRCSLAVAREALATAVEHAPPGDLIWSPQRSTLERLGTLLGRESGAAPPSSAAATGPSRGSSEPRLALELQLWQWRGLRLALSHHIGASPDPESREEAASALEAINGVCGPPPLGTVRSGRSRVLALAENELLFLRCTYDNWIRWCDGAWAERGRSRELRRTLSRIEAGTPVLLTEAAWALLRRALHEVMHHHHTCENARDHVRTLLNAMREAELGL